MGVTFPPSFLEEMQEADRVASDSGPPSVNGSTASKKRETPERDMQAALIQMCAYKEGERPALKNLYANVNGEYRPGRAPEPGLKAGVPDLFLAAARSGYNGLYLELKAKGGRLRSSQREWLERLQAAGYAAEVAWSLDEAWTTIERYLDGQLKDSPSKEDLPDG